MLSNHCRHLSAHNVLKATPYDRPKTSGAFGWHQGAGLLAICAPSEFILKAPGHLQVFLTPEYLAIAMEYATDGDMFQLVARQRGLLEKDARWYFQQLIVAVDYCHRMVRA